MYSEKFLLVIIITSWEQFPHGSSTFHVTINMFKNEQVLTLTFSDQPDVGSLETF